MHRSGRAHLRIALLVGSLTALGWGIVWNLPGLLILGGAGLLGLLVAHEISLQRRTRQASHDLEWPQTLARKPDL